MNTMNDPIKAKIIELVPEILELKFGCEVDVAGFGRMIVTQDMQGDNFQLMPYGLEEKLPVAQGEHFTVYFNRDTLNNSLNKIIGRPITLADVLRAIPVGVYMKSLGEQVRFVSYDADMEAHTGLEYWDLLSDYDGQTQATRSFIGKLIGV